MKIKYSDLQKLIKESLNEGDVDGFLGSLTKIAATGIDVATDTLKEPEIQNFMSDFASAAGVDKVGLDLFKKMFPKSQPFLDYLKSKNVDTTKFAIAFTAVLMENLSKSGIDMENLDFKNLDDKAGDVVAESVLQTLEGMNVKFGKELFGIKIPGTEELEKKTLEASVRNAVKEAIKPIILQGQKVNMPTGIVKEDTLSRGSLYRKRYYGRY